MAKQDPSKLFVVIAERNVRQICLTALYAIDKENAEKMAMKRLCFDDGPTSNQIAVINQRILSDDTQQIQVIKEIKP